MTTPDPIDNAASQFQDAGDGYNSWMPPPATTTTTHACPTCSHVRLPPITGPQAAEADDGQQPSGPTLPDPATGQPYEVSPGDFDPE